MNRLYLVLLTAASVGTGFVLRDLTLAALAEPVAPPAVDSDSELRSALHQQEQRVAQLEAELHEVQRPGSRQLVEHEASPLVTELRERVRVAETELTRWRAQVEEVPPESREAIQNALNGLHQKHQHAEWSERRRLLTLYLERYPDTPIAKSHLHDLRNVALRKGHGAEAIRVLDRFAPMVGIELWEQDWLRLEPLVLTRQYGELINVSRRLLSAVGPPLEVTANAALMVGIGLKLNGETDMAVQQFQLVIAGFSGYQEEKVVRVCNQAREELEALQKARRRG